MPHILGESILFIFLVICATFQCYSALHVFLRNGIYMMFLYNGLVWFGWYWLTLAFDLSRWMEVVTILLGASLGTTGFYSKYRQDIRVMTLNEVLHGKEAKQQKKQGEQSHE